MDRETKIGFLAAKRSRALQLRRTTRNERLIEVLANQLRYIETETNRLKFKGYA